MNKSLIGAIVVAMALLPSFASATNTAYDVPAGMSLPYVVDGTESVLPTLDEDNGDAEIRDPSFALGKWSLHVECISLVDCDGFIVS